MDDTTNKTTLGAQNDDRSAADIGADLDALISKAKSDHNAFETKATAYQSQLEGQLADLERKMADTNQALDADEAESLAKIKDMDESFSKALDAADAPAQAEDTKTE